MNRKQWMIFLLVCVFIFSFSVCGKKGVVAGKASSIDLLKLLPENPVILVSLDAHRFTSLPYFDKIVSGDLDRTGGQKIFKNYQDFIDRTGIDPKKDLFYMCLGLYGKFSDDKPQMAGVVNLKYERSKILQVLNEENVTLSEEKYRDAVIYRASDSEGKMGKGGEDLHFVFLDESNILFGSLEYVKKSLDAAKEKGKNAAEGSMIKKHLAKLNTKTLFWMMMPEIPEEAKKQAANNPMGGSVNLEKSEGFRGYIDYRDLMLNGEMELINPDEKSNQQIANLINGIKGFAALGGNENPELAELINAINITASPDNVKLTFSISDDLIRRLSEKAKEKMKQE